MEEPTSIMPRIVVCPGCEALHTLGTQTCSECGVAIPSGAEVLGAADAGDSKLPPGLPRGDDAKPSVRRGRRHFDRDAVVRSRQRQEFGRIKSVVFTVRNVYRAGCVFALAQLALFHAIAASIAGADTVAVWGLGAYYWGQFALMVAGALLVVRAPFAWAVIGATNWTITLGCGYWVIYDVGGLTVTNSVPVTYLTVMTFMMFAFWFAVLQSRRVVALMRANPELQLVRAGVTAGRTGAGRVAEDARFRRHGEFERANVSRLRVLVFATAGLALLGGGVWATTRPPSVDAAQAAFVSAWRDGDTEAIAGSFGRGADPSAAREFREGVGKRGWSAGLPELGTFAMQARGNQTMARAALRDGELVVTWQLDERDWSLARVALPPLRIGDPDGAVRAFRAAWQSSGAAALLGLMREPIRERIGPGFMRILERREWTDERPALGEHDARPRGDRVRIDFAIGADYCTALFEWWHPKWRLVGFRPPSR